MKHYPKLLSLLIIPLLSTGIKPYNANPFTYTPAPLETKDVLLQFENPAQREQSIMDSPIPSELPSPLYAPPLTPIFRRPPPPSEAPPALPIKRRPAPPLFAPPALPKSKSALMAEQKASILAIMKTLSPILSAIDYNLLLVSESPLPNPMEFLLGINSSLQPEDLILHIYRTIKEFSKDLRKRKMLVQSYMHEHFFKKIGTKNLMTLHYQYKSIQHQISKVISYSCNLASLYPDNQTIQDNNVIVLTSLDNINSTCSDILDDINELIKRNQASLSQKIKDFSKNLWSRTKEKSPRSEEQ